MVDQQERGVSRYTHSNGAFRTQECFTVDCAWFEVGKLHTNRPRVIHSNEACHMYERVTSRMSDACRMCVSKSSLATHWNE